MLFVLCNLVLRATGVGKFRFAHCKRICEAESNSWTITSCIDAMALLSQLRPSLRAAHRQGSCPSCTQGGPKVTMVDLNRATSGASPEECEDELSSLLAGLEYMVNRTAAAAAALQGNLRDACLRWCGGAVLRDVALLVVDLRGGAVDAGPGAAPGPGHHGGRRRRRPRRRPHRPSRLVGAGAGFEVCSLRLLLRYPAILVSSQPPGAAVSVRPGLQRHRGSCWIPCNCPFRLEPPCRLC